MHADNARLNFARGGAGDHFALLKCFNEWQEANYSTQWCFENFCQVRGSVCVYACVYVCVRVLLCACAHSIRAHMPN